MKRGKIVSLLVFMVLLMTFSCASSAKSKEPLPEIPRIGIKLGFGIEEPTGTVTIELRNADGSEIIWEKTAEAASFNRNASWYEYFIDTVPMLESGKKYRVYIKRSDEHSPQNAVYWKAETENPYAPGESEVKNADFCVKFFKYTNQTEEPDVITIDGNYGYFLYNEYRWQEFAVN